MRKELSDSVNKAIKNEELIEILKKSNKKNSGFILGQIRYFDDISVIGMYGITLDKQDNSKAKIFSFIISPAPIKIENGYKFKTGDSLSDVFNFDEISHLNGEYPSVKEINKRTKEILTNPTSNIISYTPFLPFSKKE